MIDNSELNRILEKLENLEDEELAVELLREFNQASSELGKLLLNLDATIPHDHWKNLCDTAKFRLDLIIKKIDQL